MGLASPASYIKAATLSSPRERVMGLLANLPPGLRRFKDLLYEMGERIIAAEETVLAAQKRRNGVANNGHHIWTPADRPQNLWTPEQRNPKVVNPAIQIGVNSLDQLYALVRRVIFEHVDRKKDELLIVSFSGEAGSGKSTMMRKMANLKEELQGEVSIDTVGTDQFIQIDRIYQELRAEIVKYPDFFWGLMYSVIQVENYLEQYHQINGNGGEIHSPSMYIDGIVQPHKKMKKPGSSILVAEGVGMGIIVEALKRRYRIKALTVALVGDPEKNKERAIARDAATLKIRTDKEVKAIQDAHRKHLHALLMAELGMTDVVCYRDAN